METFGCDLSHWQSKLNNNICEKLWKVGKIRFAYIKFSQGTGYKDDCAEYNTKLMQDFGFKVGAYHFVTLASGIQQYEWFLKCMGTIKFNLTPALDCEAYYGNYQGSINQKPNEEEEVFPVRPIEYCYYPTNEAVLGKMGITHKALSEIYGVVVPTESVVDVMAMRLCGFQGFEVPAIYTNVYYGNKIFTSDKMAKYLIWVAHWGVLKPLMPNVWKKELPYVWQDNVIDATQFGFTASKRIDHDVWMTKVPFPDEDVPPPPPPPPPADILTAKISVIKPDGTTYANDNVILERKEN